ncbi:MAG: response regulator [bacterium]
MSENNKKSVLIIEDDRGMLEDIKFAFETNKDYKFETKGVENKAEAIKLLKKIERTKDMKPYDVMVIDVRLEEERAGIALITQMIQYADKCKDTIKIIFTGWPSYEDCVNCMRGGAYDYIVKGQGKESIDKVVNSAVTRLKRLEESEEREKYIDEVWLTKYFTPEVQKKYAGKYIAVVGDEIKYSAPDYISLCEELEKNNIDKNAPEINIFHVNL